MNIFEAAAKGDIERINSLVTSGVSTNSIDDNGRTALEHAVINKQAELVKELLKLGANANICSIGAGNTLMHIAASDGDLPTLKELINVKTPLNTFNDFDYTPLHVAAGNNDTNMVSAIVEANPDIVNLKQGNGKTALTVAIFARNTEAAKKLLHLKAKIENGDLHAAAYTGNKDLVKLLVEAGEDVNKLNNQNMTSLDYAFLGIEENDNNEETVDLLLSLGAKSEVSVGGDIEVVTLDGH